MLNLVPLAFWLGLSALLAHPNPAPEPSASAIRLPAEVILAPGRLATVAADTAGRRVRWAVATEGLDLVPFPDGKTVVVAAAEPGRYTLLAWTAIGDEPSAAARTVIVVRPATPPAPQSTLERDLTTLIAADPESARYRKSLALAYRQTESLVRAGGEPTTLSALAAQLRAQVQVNVPDGALVAVRKRLAEAFVERLPSDAETPLTPALRQTAADLLRDIATILEG